MSVSSNLREFEQRIKTTLQNYDLLLQERSRVIPTQAPSQSSDPDLVQKLLREHRLTKNQEFPLEIRTERVENAAQQQETNRNSKENAAFSKEYMSFSEENQPNVLGFKENVLKDFTNQNSASVAKNLTSNSSPLLNIYSQKALKIEDLLKETQRNSLHNDKENKLTTSFTDLKVEDRLNLLDIGRNLKLFQLNMEKQQRENAEIKETPQISEQSKALALKSLRLQHNPDIIKRLLDDHRTAKLRMEKESKRREKLEENLYSFMPKINATAQGIKRTIDDLFQWEKEKNQRSDSLRNYHRQQELTKIQENLQKPMISQHSQSLLKKMGRHQKTESIEQHLLREGQRVKSSKEKMRRKKEETEKIKRKPMNFSSHNSSRSTVDPKKHVYYQPPFTHDVKKALFQEEFEPELEEFKENEENIENIQFEEQECEETTEKTPIIVVSDNETKDFPVNFMEKAQNINENSGNSSQKRGEEASESSSLDIYNRFLMKKLANNLENSLHNKSKEDISFEKLKGVFPVNPANPHKIIRPLLENPKIVINNNNNIININNNGNNISENSNNLVNLFEKSQALHVPAASQRLNRSNTPMPFVKNTEKIDIEVENNANGFENMLKNQNNSENTQNNCNINELMIPVASKKLNRTNTPMPILDNLSKDFANIEAHNAKNLIVPAISQKLHRTNTPMPVHQANEEIISLETDKGNREKPKKNADIAANIEKNKGIIGQIQDPLTLFEKKPYQIKETPYSPELSPKDRVEEVQFIENSVNPQVFSFKGERNYEENEGFPNENPENFEGTSKLKSMFIDSKSFFQKHHLQNQPPFNNYQREKEPQTEENAKKSSSVYAYYLYDEQKKNNKATPESLLYSLRYREQKIFSYHDNKLDIQDKNIDTETQNNRNFSQKSCLDVGDLSFYDRNLLWLQNRNEKNHSQIEEKKETEMKDCTFQPNLIVFTGNSLKNNKKSSCNNNNNSNNRSNNSSIHNNTKRSLDKSGSALQNDQSYLEIYKKKRGFSLSISSMNPSKNKK